MNYLTSRQLRKKLYFTITDLAEILDITLDSAKVLASRNVRRGVIIRLKRNFYCLEEKWDRLSREDFLMISNLLQVPSYVSVMTALWVYGITTQVPRDFFENASLKRSKQFDIKGVIFNYYKLKKGLYFDFIRKDNIFIATKEKAFLDTVYLYSFGKYKADLGSLDVGKLDKSKLKLLLKAFPQKTRLIAENLCRT